MDPPNLQQMLEGFAALGERHTLDLKDGTHLEGHILQVTGQFLVFFSGGPMAPEQPLFILLEDVDLQTLFYWDTRQQAYVQFLA